MPGPVTLTTSTPNDGSPTEIGTATNPLIVATAAGGGVSGNVASGATDAGNPVKIGGVYNSTLPTFTTGQRGDVQINTKGMVLTAIRSNDVSDAKVTTPSSTSLAVGVHNGLVVINHNYEFDGTQWRMGTNKPNAVSRIASAAASVNATLAKNGFGFAFRARGQNAKASIIWLKLYNKTTAPTVGTDTPYHVVAIPASAVFDIDLQGLYFSTGIAYGLTTDAADAGTTALLAADILNFTLTYA